jgi:cob(I)alamin adenosyltransferase
VEKGLVQVYTGHGKGKTTAAAGLALRAAGRGLKVAFIQFMKSDESGEVIYIENNIPEITFRRFNDQKKFPWHMNNEELGILKADTLRGIDFAGKLMAAGEADVIILDEIMAACGRGFISYGEILQMLRSRHDGVEVVMTGRDAPAEIIAAADLVTEMKNVKHPLEKGIAARTGIER